MRNNRLSPSKPALRRPGAGRPKKDAIKTSVLISREGTRLWEASAARLGITKTAALELALRTFAKEQGLENES